MSAHFKWYPSSEEVVVPWNARYSFPSQANKAVKITPRIPPKNGSQFTPGQIIRVEFPAQGYVNPINTTFEFDVTLVGYTGAIGTGSQQTWFQNNIQSIFNRVRLLYGSTPLEDIMNYNLIVRSLTEWTSTNQNGTIDQVSIAEGIGGFCEGFQAKDVSPLPGAQHVRKTFIQGFDTSGPNLVGLVSPYSVPNKQSGGYTPVPTGNTSYSTRRYQVNLALGLLTQDKLIPVKFMASQLAIELTLETAAACIISNTNGSVTGTPTYAVTNFNMIPEILEFDASYDSMFLKGLQDGGVPIKFSSWHTFTFSVGGQANINLQVQERSRSVKALFAVQVAGTPDLTTDSHATLFDSSAYQAGGNSMDQYQWRIGGRYFPAQPVQLSFGPGGANSNGGAEALVELQKALNVVGDYRLSSSVNTLRWAIPVGRTITTLGVLDAEVLPQNDYIYAVKRWTDGGHPVYHKVMASLIDANAVGSCGEQGSCCFASAIDLETSNGIEISGLNAEEQSDISLIANWKYAQASGRSMTVLSYFDAMIILRENNVLELIQ